MEPTGILTPIDQTTDAPIQDDAAKQRRKAALARVEARLAAQAAAGTLGKQERDYSQPPPLEPGLGDPTSLDSIFGGGIQALFETKDFVAGEPAPEEKSSFRTNVEETVQLRKEQSTVDGLAGGISQIAVGLIGAGKFLAPFKTATKGKAALATWEVARGAAAGAVAIDPHEERLSNLLDDYPDLQNPVTRYLAADPSDTAAEGRFKNALESIGVDLALLGAVKAIKYFRGGDTAKAAEEVTKLAQARQANANEFGMDFSGGQQAVPGGSPQVAAAGRPKLGDTAVPPQLEPKAPSGASARPQATIEQPTATLRAGEGDGAISIPSSSSQQLQAPALRLPVEVTPESISQIMAATDRDLQAIARYGSREAATEAGEVITRGARLPWQKLTGSEEVQTFLDNAATVLKSGMDEAKGGAILSDATVNARVQEITDFFGEAPDVVMGQIAEAGAGAANMVARMDAAYRLTNAMTLDSFGTATKIRNGILDDWGGDLTAATAELRAQVKASMNLLASAKAMSSNSGRALRRMRGQFRITPEAIAGVDTMDAAQLANLLYSTKGDPKTLAMAVNPTLMRRVINEGSFLLQNNLLWLYPTHVMNVTSSAIMILGRPTEKLLGSYAVGGKTGSILRRRAVKEYGATMSAIGDGWTAMVEAFKQGDSILSPHNTEFFQGASTSTTQAPLQWKRVRTPLDLAENGFRAISYRNIVGLPTRALGGADEFFKTLRYRAVIQAEAAVDAEVLGLKGQDFKDYVARKLEDAIDPATGQATNPAALREAQTATFQQELFPGSFGETIQLARSRHPVLNFVLPFVKTPINVLRYGWKMTPGLNLLQREYRDAIKGKNGPEATAHAVGQMVLSSMFMGLAANLAINGKLTGAGPSRPDLRQQLAATGWQPFSYVVEDEQGGRKFIPMGRLDPLGMAFSSVASIVEAMRYAPDEEDGGDAQSSIGALGLALAKSFTDRTFLANINQTLQALSDPGSRGEKWLASMAGNLIPASSLLRGVNPDPYLREATGFVDTMLKSVPGHSETLPPVRDAFGESIARRIGLISEENSDVVEAEHSRMILETGHGVGRPQPDLEGVDLREITLTQGPNAGRTAYDRYAELAGHIPGQPSLKEVLAKLIKSNHYQAMEDGDADVKGTRLNAIGSIVSKYRTLARKVLLRENPELRPIIGARQQEARAAYLAKKQQQAEPGAKSLIKALTY